MKRLGRTSKKVWKRLYQRVFSLQRKPAEPPHATEANPALENDRAETNLRSQRANSLDLDNDHENTAEDLEGQAAGVDVRDSACTKDDGTGNIQNIPNASMTDSEPLAPICTLWEEVYNDLDKNNPKLMKEFKEELQKSDDSTAPPTDRQGRYDQMRRVIQRKLKDIDDGRWKLEFRGHQLIVKDLVQPVASIAIWAKDYVGMALEVSAPASLAWAGVCLLLPLILNPMDATASRLDGLDKTAAIIQECALRESLYEDRYEGVTAMPLTRKSDPKHVVYRESMKALYASILDFQVKFTHYLVSTNTASRFIRDIVCWDDWDTMIQEISQKNEDLRSLDRSWGQLVKQEEWDKMGQRHEEKLTAMDILTAETKRIWRLLSESKEEKKRTDLLTWLGPRLPNYHDVASEKHKNTNTGHWFIQSDELKQWKGTPNSFLLIIGKPGGGKSVLSSTIIEYLQNERKNDPYTAVIYFYIKGNHKDTCDPYCIIRSIVAQLFGSRPDTPDSLDRLREERDKGHMPSRSMLEEAIYSAIQGFKKTYILIDGLDECPASSKDDFDRNLREELLDLLTTIRTRQLSTLHLLVTSRPEQDIQDVLQCSQESNSMKIIDLNSDPYRAAMTGDIGSFLDMKLKTRNFSRLEPELKGEIRKELLERARGVFHYVALQIEAFTTPISEVSARETLDKLPKTLETTYDGVLGRIQQRKSARYALLWVTYSLAPLTVAELATAVPLYLSDYSIPGTLSLNKFQDPLQVLDLLPGLYELQHRDDMAISDNSTDSTTTSNKLIDLTHFTLSEYLESTHIKKSDVKEFALDKDEAHLEMAKFCLEYYLHVCQQMPNADSYDTCPGYVLWKYSARFGLEHAERVDPSSWSPHLQQLVQRTLQEKDPNPMQYSITRGSVRIVEFLLKNKVADVDARFSNGENALLQAVRLKHRKFVSLLITYGADVNLKTESGETALSRALENEDIDMIRLLLDHNAYIDDRNQMGETPLFKAVVQRRATIVDLLLEYGADVTMKTKHGETLLHWTAHYNDKNLTERLLNIGADVNARTEQGETCLHWVDMSRSQNMGLITLLVDRGIDVQSEAILNETVLHLAAKELNVPCLELFLDHGADIEARNSNGETALILAARYKF